MQVRTLIIIIIITISLDEVEDSTRGKKNFGFLQHMQIPFCLRRRMKLIVYSFNMNMKMAYSARGNTLEAAIAFVVLTYKHELYLHL